MRAAVSGGWSGESPSGLFDGEGDLGRSWRRFLFSWLSENVLGSLEFALQLNVSRGVFGFDWSLNGRRWRFKSHGLNRRWFFRDQVLLGFGFPLSSATLHSDQFYCIRRRGQESASAAG